LDALIGLTKPFFLVSTLAGLKLHRVRCLAAMVFSAAAHTVHRVPVADHSVALAQPTHITIWVYMKSVIDIFSSVPYNHGNCREVNDYDQGKSDCF
jgi:hypothetical protein